MARNLADGGKTSVNRTGSAPQNAQQAIAAQANAKRASANSAQYAQTGSTAKAYGGGPLTQNRTSFNASSGGTKTPVNSPSYQTQQAKPAAYNELGYIPGSFDDPTIDWNTIYDIFIGGGGGAAGSGSYDTGTSGYSGPAPAQYQAPQQVFQMPEVQTAQSVPQVAPGITSSASGVADAPTGQQFTNFGGPGTFGEFQRLRNARGPRYNASMTPEMLRRAAASRL